MYIYSSISDLILFIILLHSLMIWSSFENSFKKKKKNQKY